jgi:hypothetical protein
LVWFFGFVMFWPGEWTERLIFGRFLVAVWNILAVVLGMLLIDVFLILFAVAGIAFVNLLEVISRWLLETKRQLFHPALSGLSQFTYQRKDEGNRNMSLAFATTNLGMTVLYSAYKYDESGTASPTRSGMLE